MGNEEPFRELTPAQVAAFEEQGYLVLERLLEEHELEPVDRFLCALVTLRAEPLVARGELTQTFASAGLERQLALIQKEQRCFVARLWHEGVVGEPLFRLQRNPKLVRIAEQLCGTEELVSAGGTYVRPKVPRNETFEVPWHQDAGYLTPRCDRVRVTAVWMALTDATEERGCLWVRPYAHREGKVFPHRRRKNQTIYIPEEELVHLPAVPVPVPRGGAVLMHNLTPHASFTNATDCVRWSFDTRYQPATEPHSAPLPEPFGASAELDGGCLPADFDAMIQSRRYPESVPRDFATWLAQREAWRAGPWYPRWYDEPT